jgi:phosphoesterase RecJ-like protein
MATCLYTTVLTDTGGFCYGGTQASTFALARELVLAGADPLRIAQEVYFSTPASKLLLLGAALGNLQREGGWPGCGSPTRTWCAPAPPRRTARAL